MEFIQSLGSNLGRSGVEDQRCRQVLRAAAGVNGAPRGGLRLRVPHHHLPLLHADAQTVMAGLRTYANPRQGRPGRCPVDASATNPFVFG